MFKDYILENTEISELELNQINADIDEEIQDAYAFANNSPYPHRSEITKYVYRK